MFNVVTQSWLQIDSADATYTRSFITQENSLRVSPLAARSVMRSPTHLPLRNDLRRPYGKNETGTESGRGSPDSLAPTSAGKRDLRLASPPRYCRSSYQAV